MVRRGRVDMAGASWAVVECFMDVEVTVYAEIFLAVWTRVYLRERWDL